MAENTIIHEISLAGYKATSTGGMLDLGTWGSYGIEKLHLTLDAAWQDLTITAFFNVNGKVVAKRVVGKDGYADVPWEATKENTFAGCLAFEGSINGQRRISTNLNYKVTNHSETTDSDPVPTDDRWNQFVTETKEYRDGAFEAAERANARAEDAETASEDAQAAAKKAQDAKSAAEKVRDDAKTAQKGAEAARDVAAKSAEAAAKSEANVKQSADTLAESVKNITPDDSSIGDKPWSSKHIIDMLCPPLEESGNPVVCYPVAGYALGVKAMWEPAQEGTGTPSPENIRPIKGRDSVMVDRCGENLFNKDGVSVGAPVYGENGTISSYKDVAVAYAKVVPGAQYSIRFRQTDSTILYIRIAFLTKSKKFIKRAYMLRSQAGIETKKTFTVSTDCEWIQFGLNNGITFNYNFDVVFVAGSAPTAYIPYIGSTNTLTLPETVYGGEVDAVSGEGKRTWQVKSLDGTEGWAIVDTYIGIYNLLSPTDSGKAICTHFDVRRSYSGDNLFISDVGTVYLARALSDKYTVDTWCAYLAAQHEAGTPVQICYKLATPTTFTATGALPMPALAGANTVLTDADSATVTGRADPIKRITDLEDAVASQT